MSAAKKKPAACMPCHREPPPIGVPFAGSNAPLLPELTPPQQSYYRVLSSALPETMALTLEGLKERYGGVEGYLATTPLKAADRAALRQRLLE